jgi:hypothetical protein
MAKKKEDLITKTKKRLASIFGPGHSPAGKRHLKQEKAKKQKEKSWSEPTKRTKDVTEQLKGSGLTEEEIARFRKKK